MGALDRIGPTAPPAAVMRILNRFNRDELSAAIAVLVELLDIWDGDADLERTDAEDDFTERQSKRWHGPGCMIADPDKCVDDEGEGIDEREPDEGDAPIPISGGGSGDC
jgi:hypothetical protein